MKLKRFKERDNKRIGIIVFTITCILLVSGVILYRTFAIFEVKTTQNVIKGNVQGMGDLEFAFYVDGKVDKKVPEKGKGYTLNTEKSKCIDLTTGEQSSNISWDNEKWEAHLKNITTTKTKCYLYFDKLYIDSTLNGENGSVGPIPDLGNEMVAITFDENGKALKADLTKDWYNYGDQRWANAVILRSKQDYAVGDVIPEENIESYFVWIPRYSYTIWNGVSETGNFTKVESLGIIADATKEERLNKAQKIEIKFETKNDAVKRGIDKGELLTHPAFTAFNSNGMWVGKFETGYDGAKTTEEASNIENTNKIDPSKVIIKPNVYSWRNIQVANAFYTTYNYKRELESHMMKNMEWGAVAYLTNSIYGRCEENGTCSEVRINNNSDYITGSSAVAKPTCGNTGTNVLCNQYGTNNNIVIGYNNSASVASSTTNNYYGVFDMAGGSWEYVMGVMQSGQDDASPTSGRSSTYNSGFNGKFSCPTCDGADKPESLTDGRPWPSSKYYDLYDYTFDNTNYKNGKLGDGTKEFGHFILSNSLMKVDLQNM